MVLDHWALLSHRGRRVFATLSSPTPLRFRRVRRRIGCLDCSNIVSRLPREQSAFGVLSVIENQRRTLAEEIESTSGERLLATHSAEWGDYCEEKYRLTVPKLKTEERSIRPRTGPTPARTSIDWFQIAADGHGGGQPADHELCRGEGS
jgi:hypothetical protein